MTSSKQQPTVPNTGRILDYWLGGTHHFAPDIGAAQAFDSIFPGFPRVFSTLRQFIGRAVTDVSARGVSQFLVLGSGIPTRGNVHEAVPDARVLYTDIDPTNIALGREILRDVPRADYAYCDASDLSTLDATAVSSILDLNRPLGIVMVGVAVFLPDAVVANTLARLHEWAPRQSYLVADFDGEALDSFPAVKQILDQAGEPLHLRGPTRIRPLLGRWTVTQDGLHPVDVWNNPEADVPPRVFMYGCVAARD